MGSGYVRVYLWPFVFCACAIIVSECDSDSDLFAHWTAASSTSTKKPPYMPNNYKMALTQQGYIQFLRYVIDVPPLKEFTFCIWLKSTNFTHAHPLLSYSHDERDRFIRAWVSPHGLEINLAILETVVLNVPVHLLEHQWYHICQSWSSLTGHASLLLNGKLIRTQQTEKVRGSVLPKNGDLVVGQEYTDFDKGLEDGIEGFIYGFNMVLESVFAKLPPHRGNPFRFASVQPRPFAAQNQISFQYRNTDDELDPLQLVPVNLIRRNYDEYEVKNRLHPLGRPYILRRYRRHVELENSLAASDVITNGNATENIRKNREAELETRWGRYVGNYYSSHNKVRPVTTPLGLQLVHLGYRKCVRNRGAPLAGRGVLVSWTMTPVRVFGGIIVKPASPVCGNF